MSRAELIAIVDHASSEDRLLLQAYMGHLARTADPQDARDLDTRLENMRSGNEVSLDEARKLHDTLSAQGL